MKYFFHASGHLQTAVCWVQSASLVHFCNISSIYYTYLFILPAVSLSKCFTNKTQLLNHVLKIHQRSVFVKKKKKKQVQGNVLLKLFTACCVQLLYRHRCASFVYSLFFPSFFPDEAPPLPTILSGVAVAHKGLDTALCFSQSAPLRREPV